MLGAELSLQFFNVVLLTFAVAPIVLWRYRRAVLTGMQGGDADTALPVAPADFVRPLHDGAGVSGRQAADADIATTPEFDGARRRHAETADGVGIPVPQAATAEEPARLIAGALAWEKRLRRRVFGAALLATFVPSLLLAVQYLSLGDLPLTPAHLLLKAGVLCSAAVPVFAVLTATPFGRALRIWVVTLLVFAVAMTLLSMAQRPFYGKAPSLDQLFNLWAFMQLALFTLWLPTLLGLAIGARRVRGVAPFAFAGLLVFGFAPLLGPRLTQWLVGTEAGSAWVLSGFGFEAGHVLLALPIGWLAWQRLKRVARAYQAKRFSDAQLLAGTWWLLIVALEAIDLINAHPAPRQVAQILAVCAIAYLLFAPLLAWGLRRALDMPGRPGPRTLLLLRVFGDTARTEALFDRVGARWRFFGPLTVIAAPDVVARTVDPGDVLRLALGAIDADFVKSRAGLDARLAGLDLAPDPDGRHRVNEFCCRATTWQATVVALIERADAVLMDLRGFTAERHGCEFELRELAARVDPRRVVLVVDRSTDSALLARSSGGVSEAMRVVDVDAARRGDADAVFGALLRAAG